MIDDSVLTTFLFTDIEGSTSLWEREPLRMRDAIAGHDRVLRAAVERNRGRVVKMMGDGMHAVFGDPPDALGAVVELQQALADPAATAGIPLAVRCGLHVGSEQRRDDDFFGRAVNRAARIMGVAHGGQVLLSEALATLVRDRLPPGVTLRDLGEVRLRDLGSPEHVYQVQHPQLRAEFPALRALTATPNNLPQQLTSFVGRERELAEVRGLLAKARLLTLTGAGGIGKTRLSLELGAEVIADYPDGVWLVELAAITDSRLVPHAVASVLGVKEDAGRPVQEALVRHFRDRRLLVILDNCEHLLPACAELARVLLQAGPQIRLLASSREPLHVAGEASYPVPALAVPGTSATIAPAALVQYASASLFVDRALAAQPAFRVTERNAVALAEICQRLDGIPLAIELAAARTSVLSVENIASRLDDRFRLLRSGDSAALPRQQTLGALIDWSYDLLDVRERALFRRLAVFAGGFTLEAAETVGSDGELDRGEALDVLTQLVEKSLVALDPDSGRYRLLETVRQYAAQRLEETGEDDAARDRHFGFHLALAEAAAAGLAGPEQPAWLKRLDAERENVLAAHAWGLGKPENAENGYRLVHAIKLYWFMRGLLNLGHRVAAEAVSVAPPQPHSLARCRALWVAGQICSYTGRYEEALRYLEESLAIARHHDDKPMIAGVRNYLALAALGLGDRASAKHHCEEALTLARESGSKREIAVASNGLAQLSRLDGDLDRAERLYDEALAMARDLADREFAAVGTLGLAMVAIGRGAIARGRELLRDAFALAAATGSRPAGQSALEVAVGLAAAHGDWRRAARLHGFAEAQTSRTGIRRDPADESFLRPWVVRTRAALGEPEFAAAEVAGRELSFETAEAEVSAWLAGGG